MDLKRIYNNLGLLTTYQEEVKKFNWRILLLITEIENKFDVNTHKSFFRKVLFKLGYQPPKPLFLTALLEEPSGSQETLRRNLLILQIILEELKELSRERIYHHYMDYEKLYEEIEQKVKELFSLCLVEVGFTYKNGFIIQSGAEELDEKLIIDVLEWLKDFPQEKKDFENALKAYLEKRYSDVIGDCYNCVEGMARRILGNRKVLENNKDELLKKLQLSQEWRSILSNFINYANEYKRHASEKRHKINPDEVEAFMYLTGLILRLCIKNG